MKKLLYTTTAFVLCGYMAQANAACIATPTCSSLGYTSSSSCDGGLKCPFGEAWNCELNKINELTNKVTELEKTIEKIEQENVLRSCAIGNIFYSDWTCSTTSNPSKTAIGVVVYTDGQGHGQVLALKSIGDYKWSTEYVDIPTLTNFSNAQNASYDINSCSNTEKIMAAGDKSKYPAAWAAHEYSTEGTKAGDWCLPAAGILTSYYNNQQLVNIGLMNVGGTQFTSSSDAWSSSQCNSTNAWYSNVGTYQGFGDSYGLSNSGSSSTSKNKSMSREVRPILVF